MRWLSGAALCLMAAASAPASAQTTILGHHLGETVTQFLAEEPELASRMEACRAAEPKPLTPEQIHALSKGDANALGEQVFAKASQNPDSRFPLKWVPKKGQLEELARQGMPITMDKRMPEEIAACHALLALTAPPGAREIQVQSLPHTRTHPVTWHFVNGTLTEMDVDLHGGNFDEVADDFSQKTGSRPVQNHEIDTPNMFGALLHVQRKAEWLTPELYALLTSDGGVSDVQMHLVVLQRAAYDAVATKPKNTLD